MSSTELSLINLELENFAMVGYSSLMLPSVTMNHVVCSREVKLVSIIPEIILTNHVGLPCVSIQCWISQIYQIISTYFVSVDVGCINSLLLMDLLLSMPNHHLGNGSRNPSEYLISCSHH